MFYKFRQIIRQIIGKEGVLLSHQLRARLAAFLYGYPGRKLKVIGVTGTNGKTTTCFLIAHILQEAGHRVGMATTVEFLIGTERIPNRVKMTTLSPFALQGMLARMVRAGCRHAVLEVTSHAIAQERIFGITFDTVVFTNLTHDHLDYHQSFEEYRNTKVRLFQSEPRVAVVNVDDKSASYFLKPPADLQITYGLDREADIKAKALHSTPTGTVMEIAARGGAIAKLALPLPGKFNAYNALAALAAVLGAGVPMRKAIEAMEHFSSVPGRMERIEQGQPFAVYVDYAHTPDAFQQIYATLRPATQGKIIHVFGATGDRDKTKRPLLGAIAARFADYIVVTDEDPYSEDPLSIMEAVSEGIVRASRTAGSRKKEGVQFWKILDRRQAIAQAFSLAKKGDLVLLTGKGAENVMVVGSRHVPWDDRQVAREELEKIGYKG